MDYQTKEVLEEQIIFLETRFPFIPTYFTFREVPFVERLLATCSERPSVLLLDGQGILHPRRCGFASHAGVLTNQPTIGVAKSLLCGSLDGDQVSVDGEVRGHAVRSGAARRPVYVSAGHKVSLASSVRIVSALSTRKEPEPLRRAHELATSHLAEGRQG
jgi:deoxyribonuclease V